MPSDTPSERKKAKNRMSGIAKPARRVVKKPLKPKQPK